MARKSKFKVSKFTYPSGGVAWRVSGSLDGRQIRKNFDKRQDAVDEKQRLEIKRVNGETYGRQMWVRITQEQHDDAWAAIQQLTRAGSKRSLCFAVDYMLKHFPEAAEEKTLEDAVREYLEEKSREEGRGVISSRQYGAIQSELERFLREMGEVQLGEIRTENLKSYLEKVTTSLKTWNNRRGYLSTFFKFCLARKYLGNDPVLDVPQHKIKHRRGTADTLTADQATALMAFLETYEGENGKGGKGRGYPGCMVPYFALALFAGIRPDWQDGEIKKLRPEHIDLENGVIRIEPEVSKVHEKRSIRIQPNLRLWLERYPPEAYPFLPSFRFPSMRMAIRKRFKLGHDILRHTFISMLVGAFRSVGDASLQAGNSEAIIRKHYLDLKTTEEADKFWRIVPAGIELPENSEKKDGIFVFSNAV